MNLFVICLAFLVLANSYYFTTHLKKTRFRRPQYKSSSFCPTAKYVDTDDANEAQSTRAAIIRIVEESWYRVNQLIPEFTLRSCEEELKIVTCLLVLASVRRSAEDNPESKAIVEKMFQQADVNGDGQLTFFEWFNWLGETVVGNEADTTNNMLGAIEQNLDPMVVSLSNALSHAVCVVNIVGRMTDDASLLAAAFSAGGILSGSLDTAIAKALLGRFSFDTRALIMQAISLESSTIGTSFTPKRPPFLKERLTNANSGLAEDIGNDALADVFFSYVNSITSKAKKTSKKSVWAMSLAVPDDSKAIDKDDHQIRGFGTVASSETNTDKVALTNITRRKFFGHPILSQSSSSSMQPRQNLNANAKQATILTVDLSSIPALTAPPIIDESADLSGTVSQLSAAAAVSNDVDDTIMLRSPLPAVEQASSLYDTDDMSNLEPSHAIPEPLYTSTSTSSSSSAFRTCFLTSSNLQSLVTSSSSSPDTSSPPATTTDVSISAADAGAVVPIVPLLSLGSSFPHSLFRDENEKKEVLITYSDNVIGAPIVSEITSNELSPSLLHSPSLLPSSSYRDTTTASNTQCGTVAASSSSSALILGSRGQGQVGSPKSLLESGSIMSTVRSNANVDETLLYAEAINVIEDIQQIRYSVDDIGDANAGTIRQVLMAKAAGRVDALGLACALRAARLQHAMSGGTAAASVSSTSSTVTATMTTAVSRASLAGSARQYNDKNGGSSPSAGGADVGYDVNSRVSILTASKKSGIAYSKGQSSSSRYSNSYKQRLALDTLQVWAPLSFQIGMASNIPELEVHSNILLFPGSFGSFMSWYDHFRPQARKLLGRFRDKLQAYLLHDKLLPCVASKVLIQTRMKSSTSAFKKMLKSSKKMNDLHDMLGIRIIISARDVLTRFVLNNDTNALITSDTVTENSIVVNVESVDNFSTDTVGSVQDEELEDEARTKTEKVAEDSRDEATHDNNRSSRYGDAALTKFRTAVSLHANEERQGQGQQQHQIPLALSSPQAIETVALMTVLSIVRNMLHPNHDHDGDQRNNNKYKPTYNAMNGWNDDSEDIEDREDVTMDDSLGEYSSSEWSELKSRFKDYVSNPKPSGYQSIHLTLQHQSTRAQMEVQLRSKRMHDVAEYGSASHTFYKALALPERAAQ